MRLVLAAISLVVFTVITISLSIFTLRVMYPLANAILPIGLMSELEAMGYRKDSIYYLKDHDVYTSLGWIALCVALASILTLILFHQWVPRIQKLVLVGGPLFLAIPLSAANYVSGDIFSSRSVQAVMNLPIVFLSAVAVWELAKVPTVSPAANIARLFALAMVVMQGISIPALYSILWWLNFQGGISLAATRDLSPGWISAAAGAVGLAFSVYKHLDDKRSKADGANKAKDWKPLRPRSKG